MSEDGLYWSMHLLLGCPVPGDDDKEEDDDE
jgi:hypothetical protein